MAKIETVLSDAQVKIAEALFAAPYAVTLGKREGNPTVIDLPLADMPVNAWLKIVRYGAQRTFNDAVGGADTVLADKVAAVNAMVADYVKGDVGRKVAAGVDAVTAEIRTILRGMVKAQVGAEKWKSDWADADDLGERLDAVFAKQPEAAQATLRETAETNIAERAARKAKLAGLGATIAL